MKKFMEKYNLFEERVLILSLAFNVLLVFTQIIMRSIFNLSLSWSEELSRYMANMVRHKYCLYFQCTYKSGAYL